MRIEINGIPPSLNQFVGRQNVWAYRQAKKEWTDLVYYAAVSQKPRMPLSSAFVHIHVVYPDKRRHDVGNHEKFLTDGLVKAGIIADDDYSHIELLQTGWWEKGVSKTSIFVQKTETPKHVRHKLALAIPLSQEERLDYRKAMSREDDTRKAIFEGMEMQTSGRGRQ